MSLPGLIEVERVFGQGPREWLERIQSNCTLRVLVRSLLPVGRIDLSVLVSGYSNSGFALVDWA
jgi:hypothetical protein